MDHLNAQTEGRQNFAEPPNLDAVFTAEARRGRPRINAVRADVFDGALDAERAYWLGFIYADGLAAHNPYWTLTVCLAAKDSEHVRALHALLGGRVTTTAAGATRLLIHSKELCRGLAERGVVPRKSYEPVSPPSLGGNLRRPFLCGLFDGDGCFHRTKRGNLQAALCGHPAIVDWFCEQVAIAPNGTPPVRGGAAYAQWTSASRAADLARLLYGVPAPRLARKANLASGV